jgi:hypothetical protein
MFMGRAWDGLFDDAVNEIASVRRDAGSFDSRVLGIVGAEREGLLRGRASVHVWLAAIMERFVTGWLSGMCAEFNSLGLKWRDVRLSLFSVACGADLQSLSDGLKKGAWLKRVSMFDRTSDGGIAILDSNHGPLDGRTIRPSHLDEIWMVFGLASSPFPSPIHRVVLTTIADQRNDIAHGKVRPAVAGGKYTYFDYERHIARIEDIVEHIAVQSEDYFIARRYFR